MKYTELNVPAEIHKAVERMGFTERAAMSLQKHPPAPARRVPLAFRLFWAYSRRSIIRRLW